MGCGLARLSRPPAWVTMCMAAFCALELILLGYARATSAIAHLRAAQDLMLSSQLSAGEAAAGCAEASAAVDALAPVLLPLNAARVVPFSTARAWGEVPRLAEATQVACRAVEVYARVAPWGESSIEQGAAADALAEVRGQRQRLGIAVLDLAQAWTLVDRVDLPALSAEPRLERVTRALSGLRAQRADISDALALATPERAETLLGGHGALAVVLEVRDSNNVGQAHIVLDQGRLLAVEVGRPAVPVGAMLTVDHLGLSTLLGAVGSVPVPEIGGRVSAKDLDDVLRRSPEGATAAIARAILQEITQKNLSNNVPAVAALKKDVEQHLAWLWFEDPALEAIVIRHGWARL